MNWLRRPSTRLIIPPVDSWIVPRRVAEPVGLRTGALADFQLVCGAGPYELDLLVRDLEAEPTIELAGQVTRSGWMSEPVPMLPLLLVEANRGAIVANAATDTFGEFDMSSSREGQYGLLLGDDEHAPCILVWEGAE